MFCCLYYSVTFKISKEKFEIAFYSFTVIKKVAPLSSSDFLTNLICWGVVVFVRLDKSIEWVYNSFGDASNLISALLYSYRFLTFWQVFHWSESVSYLQSFTKYLRLTLVFLWNSALWEKFYFCFSRVVFILAGRLGTRLSFFELYSLSSYFLIS